MKNNIKDIKMIDDNVLGRQLYKDNDIKVALHDILEDNVFYLLDSIEKQYCINIEIIENTLILNVLSFNSKTINEKIAINIKSISKILREYIILCNSYYDAIKSSPIQKVEALDMGRRSLHDDASHELVAKLKESAYMDFNTARRFTTLLSIIYRKSMVGENILT